MAEAAVAEAAVAEATGDADGEEVDGGGAIVAVAARRHHHAVAVSDDLKNIRITNEVCVQNVV